MQPREQYTSVFFRGHLYNFGGCQLQQYCYNDVFIMNIVDFCPNKCNSHGVCKKELGCACNIGYSDHDCSVKTKCKNDCSNHGYCHNNAKCGCFSGYSGPYCDVNLNCPKNCTSLDNGYCSNNGTCICKEGFSGSDCAESSSCDVIYVPRNFNLTNLNISNLKNFTNFNNNNSTKNQSHLNNLSKRYSEFSKRLLKFDIQLKNLTKNKNLFQNNNKSHNKTHVTNKSLTSNYSKSLKINKTNKSNLKEINLELYDNGSSDEIRTIPVFLQTHFINNSVETTSQKLKRNSVPKDETDEDPALIKKKDPKNLTNFVDEEDELTTKKKKNSKSIADVENGFMSGAEKDKVWIFTKKCYNNCTNRGICLNSTCFCDQGFTYYDCSLTYKDFTLLGFKFQDMIFILIIVFVSSVVITGLCNLLSKNKSSDDYLELD